jgi:hypothetical protein
MPEEPRAISGETPNRSPGRRGVLSARAITGGESGCCCAAPAQGARAAGVLGVRHSAGSSGQGPPRAPVGIAIPHHVHDGLQAGAGGNEIVETLEVAVLLSGGPRVGGAPAHRVPTESPRPMRVSARAASWGGSGYRPIGLAWMLSADEIAILVLPGLATAIAGCTLLVVRRASATSLDALPGLTSGVMQPAQAVTLRCRPDAQPDATDRGREARSDLVYRLALGSDRSYRGWAG